MRPILADAAPPINSAGPQSPTPTPSDRDVTRWLEHVIDPDQVVELRVPKPFDPDQKVITRIYKAGRLAELAREAILLSGRAEGVYNTLNPIRLPLGKDSKGKVRRSAADEDILCRRRLLIDCDPRRPKDVSATDTEKAAALATAAAVRDHLKALGWPDPVEADSGNGGHLIYFIDLPNDDAGRELVKSVLQALAARFDSPAVSIDTTVYNASRICKLYGTLAAKGVATAERPHRLSRVLKVPGAFTPVSRELLEALAAEASASPPATAPPRPRGKGHARTADGTTISPSDRLARAGAYLDRSEPAVSGQKGHDRTFKLACKIGPGFDLAPDDAFALLRDRYNPRCLPPWSEAELRHKVDDAYERETRRGFLLDAPPANGKHRPGSNGKHRPGSNDSEAVDATANGKPPDGPARPDGDPPRDGRPNEAVDDPHRLARLFAHRRARHPDGLTLRYWLGEWHRWDGTAYRTCPEKEIRAEVTAAIKAEFNRRNRDQLRAHEDPDKPPPTCRPVTTKLVGNVLQALAGVALLGSRECPRQPAWIDGDAPFPADEVLPARNALIHLPSLGTATRAVLPPTPRLFCPYALDYDFALDAPAPVNWLTFLGERPVGPDSAVKFQLWPDDPQSRDTLQEWMGLQLVPDTRDEKICTIIGPKRSGKGTIARVMTALVGPENVVNPTLTSLSTPFGLAPLIGKLAAIIPDARLSPRTDVAQVVERLLSISGEDGLTIDRKHREQWTGKLVVRWTLISNEIPRLIDSSGSLVGRVILLRLTRSFYGNEDSSLMAKLLPELPGILLWAIAGWRRLRDRGRFVQPESGRPLVELMEAMSSSVGMFVAERCSVGPDHRIKVADLYAAWKAWCAEKGKEQPGEETVFGRNLHSALPELVTKTVNVGGKYSHREYRGVDLVDVPAF